MKKVFGIVGCPLGHSFSKQYFTDKFQNIGENDFSFDNFLLENITDLPEKVLSIPDLQGFCITIPHKQNLIPFLDHISPEVQEIGACNCVRFKGGQLTGYNTDIIGFEKSFSLLRKENHKKALVLGTGGASKAVVYVLEKLEIPYQLVSRNKANTLHYDAIDATVLAEYSIIINASPVGTFPNVDQAPTLPYQWITADHYLYDLVYNPATTAFLAKGKSVGATTQNGYQMLLLQAEENWKIWNS